MRVPDEVQTLTDLTEWENTFRPTTIEINVNNELRNLMKFPNGKKWEWYKGISVKYTKYEQTYFRSTRTN